VTGGHAARRWCVLLLGVALVCSTPTHARPADGEVDFTRLVVLGDGMAAGESNGSLFDGQSAPAPVTLGQGESFAAHLGAAMGTPVVFQRIEYPGIAGRNQLVLVPGFCEFEADAFSFLLGIGSRVDPLEVPNVLAVPRHKLRDALRKRWEIDPGNLATVDSDEDFLLGFPGVLIGAAPTSQVEAAIARQPTFAAVWLGLEDVLTAARRGNAKELTRRGQFDRDMDEVLGSLRETGAQVAVATVPDPTVLPYFMSQRELRRFLKDREEPGDPKVTNDGLAILFGVRRGGYVTRTFQTLITIEGIAEGLQPAPLVGTQRLDPREVRRIRRAVRRYNRSIARQARRHGAVLVDLHALFRRMHRDGVVVDGTRLTTSYLGGLFGLDGLHLTNTGHAVVAQAFVDAINAQCGTSLEGPDIPAVLAEDPMAVCVVPAAPETLGR